MITSWGSTPSETESNAAAGLTHSPSIHKRYDASALASIAKAYVASSVIRNCAELR
jgi:hypothetical protein